jgi:predicted metal-dependent hydrolase
MSQLMVETSELERVQLPDGRSLYFEIQRSAKTHTLRLKLSARYGLVVVAPLELDKQRILKMVDSKATWISDRLRSFAAVRHLMHDKPSARPQAFDLPALAQSWRVEYKETRSRTVGARTDQPGRLVVSGSIEDVDACHAALRRWLARHATSTLSPWLAQLAKQTGLTFADLAVKNQRTRWGSCSATGRISLNCKLLFLSRDCARYVMLHELTHLLEFNHSEKFWMHLRHFEPQTDLLHGRMRDAWKLVPIWAQSGAGLYAGEGLL